MSNLESISPKKNKEELNQPRIVEKKFADFADEFLTQFPNDFEKWFDGNGSFFYFKVKRTGLGEVSMSLMNLRDKSIPSSSAKEPLGDFESPNIIYTLDLTFRKNTINLVILTGEPLPKTMITRVLISAKRLIRIGLISKTGKINTKIFHFPIEDEKLSAFPEIYSQLIEIMEYFRNLTKKDS